MRPTKDPRIVPAVVAATAADAASRTPLAVLEELLTHSIRLRDLYKNARWQFPSSQFGGLRRILDDHYKEQVSLIDVILDRIRVLGGTVGVFAGEQQCESINGVLLKSEPPLRFRQTDF
jgi:DNA-binding ferritin-like protein